MNDLKEVIVDSYSTPQWLEIMHMPNPNILPNPHLQLIGVNSEKLSLTSVIQQIMSSEKLKYLLFGYPLLSAFLECQTER